MRGSGSALDADRDHGRMFEQQQDITYPTRAAVFDELPLQRDCVAVWDLPEMVNLESARHSSGKFSRIPFTLDMNWSATAPSMIR